MIRPENTDFIRGVLANDVLTFTRYFFKAQFGRKFIIGKHHVAIANALGEVLRGECTRLIVNVPPRYGKTELVVKNFIAMGLALNPASKFLHLSYSAALAEDNSVAVKDILNLDAYKRLFPATRIKEGADTKTKWATTAGGGHLVFADEDWHGLFATPVVECFVVEVAHVVHIRSFIRRVAVDYAVGGDGHLVVGEVRYFQPIINLLNH